MKKILKLNNVEATNQFGKLVGTKLANNMVILLKGELGAGKTTFAKAMLGSLDIEEVQSPTFTIVKEYQGKYKVIHMDLYRLNNEEIDHEIDDYIYSDGIKIIEWPDNQKEIMPEKHMSVTISKIDENKREFLIEANDDIYDVIGEDVDFFIIKNQFSDNFGEKAEELREAREENVEERRAQREAELEERKAKREAERLLREEERTRAKAEREERAAIRELDKARRDEEAKKRKARQDELESKRTAELEEIVAKILELEKKNKELHGLTDIEMIELRNLKSLARAMGKQF